MDLKEAILETAARETDRSLVVWKCRAYVEVMRRNKEWASTRYLRDKLKHVRGELQKANMRVSAAEYMQKCTDRRLLSFMNANEEKKAQVEELQNENERLRARIAELERAEGEPIQQAARQFADAIVHAVREGYPDK